MRYRLFLTSTLAALTINGCAKHPAPDTAAFASGPSQINITHLSSSADDGSAVFLTVDGSDAGELAGGNSVELHITPGKHKIGGYVRTLFGFGQVTIDPIEITAAAGERKRIAYSVQKEKPGFAEQPVSAG